jgi:DNA-binding CsgD family transcriptional regulator
MEVGLYGMDSYLTPRWASETGRRYLRGFLTPNRLLNNICIHVLLGNERKLFLLDFHRPSSATPFSGHELALAQMICPAIQLLCTESLAPGGRMGARRESQDTKTCRFEFGALDVATEAAPSAFRQSLPDDASLAELTDRQRDVMLAVMKGLSNKETARRLGLSVRTVENHLRVIYKKYDVHTRAQLTASLIGLIN